MMVLYDYIVFMSMGFRKFGYTLLNSTMGIRRICAITRNAYTESVNENVLRTEKSA